MDSEPIQSPQNQELLKSAREWGVAKAQISGLLERTLARQRRFDPAIKETAFPQNQRYRSMLSEVKEQEQFALFRAGIAPKPKESGEFSHTASQPRLTEIMGEIRGDIERERLLLSKFGDGRLHIKRDFIEPLFEGVSIIPNVIGGAASLWIMGNAIKEQFNQRGVDNETSFAAAPIALAFLFGRKKLRAFENLPKYVHLSETLQLRVLNVEAQMLKTGDALRQLANSTSKNNLSDELRAGYEALELSLRKGTTDEVSNNIGRVKDAYITMWDKLAMKHNKTTEEKELLKVITGAIAEFDRI